MPARGAHVQGKPIAARLPARTPLRVGAKLCEQQPAEFRGQPNRSRLGVCTTSSPVVGRPRSLLRASSGSVAPIGELAAPQHPPRQTGRDRGCPFRLLQQRTLRRTPALCGHRQREGCTNRTALALVILTLGRANPARATAALQVIARALSHRPALAGPPPLGVHACPTLFSGFS
jgi:hypothetical protein